MVLNGWLSDTYQRGKLTQVMRDDQYGTLLVQLFQCISNLDACAPVQPSQRLVKQQHLQTSNYQKTTCQPHFKNQAVVRTATDHDDSSNLMSVWKLSIKRSSLCSARQTENLEPQHAASTD